MELNMTGPINLGNPNEISIYELANKIKAKINKNLNIIYNPLPEDDPKKKKPRYFKSKKIFKVGT